MGKYDTAILELLEETELALPPKVIAFNLKYLEVASPAISTVQRRLGILEQNSFVEKVEKKSGYYTISNQGLSYLNEDVSTESGQLQQDTKITSEDQND